MRLRHYLFVLLAPFAATAAPLLEMPSRTLEGPPAARAVFRAPTLAPAQTVALPAPLQTKAAAFGDEPLGALRVGEVRALPKAISFTTWTPIAGGYVARIRASSAEALGLRARLVLGAGSGPLEARVQGHDGRIETMTIDGSSGNEAWTPWTEGPTQLIELFAPALPASDAVQLGAVAHFTNSPFAKNASSCTVNTPCTTADSILDAAIAERKRSTARITFVRNGDAFVCSATLVNTDRFPVGFLLTANHCINNAAAAATVSTFWFYESTACEGGMLSPTYQQVSGGTQLVFGNWNVDTTLLQTNQTPPTGASYASWNAAPLAANAPIVSISHPAGDTSRFALGFTTALHGVQGYPHPMLGVRFTRGIIEGGSSGSGLFTIAPGGSLQLRGVLVGTTVRNSPLGLTCTNLDEEALYSRLEMVLPQIDPFIHAVPPRPPDDAVNRAQDLFTAPFLDPNGVDKPLNERGGTTLALDNKSVDYVGDLDVFRFRLTAASYVSAWSEGSEDTVGNFLGSNGANLESNDDGQWGPNLNFGMTRRLEAGTYYVQVGHFDADGTGAYNLRLRAENVGTNYTDLWWNSAESGWGVNVNHQDNTIFATLFTYDANGVGTWFSMSGGTLQPDGTYLGTLYRTTGPMFNSTSWPAGSIVYEEVGTMRFSFTTANTGILTYTVRGAQVVKAITRIEFDEPPACGWDRGDRAYALNYQDLWWDKDESGWGLNITHQGDILFATLFTYGTNGQPMWLLMSNGARSGDGYFYSGELYRTHGPPFNAVPFTPIGPANHTLVGTMSLQFTNGNLANLSYSVNGVQVSRAIERLPFGGVKTKCVP